MHTKKAALWWGVTIFLTTGINAAIRVAPGDPIADRLVAEALANAPEVNFARATAEAARRRVQPAATLPDPMISSAYQQAGEMETDPSELELMLSQPIPWPGKLRLAGSRARSEAREIEAGFVGRTERSIEARVRNAWYDLLLARELDQLLEQRRGAAQQIEQTVRDRYAAGLAVQQDVLRAQIELVRVDEQQAAQRAVITARLAELNRLVGRPQDDPRVESAGLPGSAAAPLGEEVIPQVIAASPEVAAARQGIETGRLGVDLAKKNFLPDLVVSAGPMFQDNLAMGPMWQVGVGVSVPAWLSRRQRNQLSEAQAQLNAREAESSRTAAELELRTRERLAQLNAAAQIATLYRERIVPLDNLSLESALASYSAGKVPFITVLDALNTLYADRAAALARIAESAKWRVAIDEASLAAVAMTSSAPMAAPASSMSGSATPMPAATASASSSMTSMR